MRKFEKFEDYLRKFVISEEYQGDKDVELLMSVFHEANQREADRYSGRYFHEGTTRKCIPLYSYLDGENSIVQISKKENSIFVHARCFSISITMNTVTRNVTVSIRTDAVTGIKDGYAKFKWETTVSADKLNPIQIFDMFEAEFEYAKSQCVDFFCGFHKKDGCFLPQYEVDFDISKHDFVSANVHRTWFKCDDKNERIVVFPLSAVNANAGAAEYKKATQLQKVG